MCKSCVSYMGLVFISLCISISSYTGSVLKNFTLGINNRVIHTYSSLIHVFRHSIYSGIHLLYKYLYPQYTPLTIKTTHLKLTKYSIERQLV